MNSIGHLVIVRTPNDHAIRGSLFLWTEGLANAGAEMRVLEGIRKIAETRRKDAVIEVGVTGDYSRMHLEYPEAAGSPHFAHPVCVFIDPLTEQFDGEFFWCGVENWLAGWHQFFPAASQGAVVRQDCFYGRKAFIETVQERLNTERWLLISAPRRYGKTSVLLAFQDRYPALSTIYVDLEDLASFDQLIARLHAKLLMLEGQVDAAEERATERSHLKSISAMSDERKREEALSLFRQLNERGVLLLFDELGYFVQNLLGWKKPRDKATAESALETLAAYSSEFRNTQALFASSISLKQFLQYNELRNTGFEPLCEEPLPPLTNDEASRLIRALLIQGRVYDCSKESLEALLEIASPPIPYFIQVLVDEVIMARVPLTPNNIRRIYQENVIGPNCRRHFDQLIWHLDRYLLQEHSRAVRRVLNIVANRPGGRASRNELRTLVGPSLLENQFNLLLQLLEFDCYLVGHRENGEMYYSFHNRMMRDYVEKNPLP